jgi:hypothetical protein
MIGFAMIYQANRVEFSSRVFLRGVAREIDLAGRSDLFSKW